MISDRKPAWFPTQAVRLWLLLTAALPLWAQMDNDNFANRLQLESRGGIPELTLLNASRELGEQGPVGAALGEVSVWLSWTPAQSGPARLFLLPAAGSPPWAPLPPSRVVVATGSALGSLTPVVRIDASGFTNFVAEAGREYVVGVVGINGGVFRAGVTPVPSNDEFSSAAVLTGNASSFLATTLGATASIFDPTTLQQKPTVWWHWTAPEAGTLTFQLSQPAGSMILQSFADQASSRQDRWLDGNGLLRASQVTAGESVFFGVAGEITEENLVPVHLTLSSLRLEIGGGPAGLQKGVPATIALEDRPEGVRFVRAGLGNVDSPLREAAGDDLTLVWTPEHSGQYSLRGFAVDEAGRIWTTRETLVSVRPANDDFADATILSTGASATEFSLAGATSEAGEPEPLEPTVWFSWTAAETGLAGVSVSRRASLAGLRVRILSGDTLGGLRLLAENGQTNNRAQRRLAIFPAEGGQRHWIVASGWLTGITPLQLQIVPQAELPLNDDFTNRLVLSGSELTVTNQMRFATLEPGEERINFHGNSVWHEWIAAAPGELALTATSGSNTFPSVMAYWQGDFPPVRLPDLSSGPSIRLLVMPGTNYFIGQTAWALSPAQLGTTLLNLRFQPAAFNDLFANRQVEAGTDVPFEGTTAAAGFEPGEAPPRLRTVWHTWTAPRSGDVMVWPITPAELRIYVFRGETLQSLEPIGGGPIRRFRALLLPVTAGQTYQFAFATPRDQPGGPFQAGLRYHDPQANDAFADRTPLAGSRVVFPGVNSAATNEAGEPEGLTNTLWWSWTAPADGWATLESVDVALGVFSGNTLASLAPVEVERTGDIFSYHSLRFRVRQGQVYQIASMPTANGASPYSVKLDLTSLAFAEPTANAWALPGQPLNLRMEPIDWAVDGLPAGGLVSVVGILENGLRLTHLLATNDLTWTVTNNLPIGIAQFTASYTNLQGEVRSTRPLPLVVQHDNDQFANPERITDAEWHRDYLFHSATREPGESALSPATLGGSLWWHWTAPQSGDVLVRVGFSVFGVFVGNRFGELTAVPYTGIPNTSDQAVFRAERDVTYHLKLEGYAREDRGTISLKSYPLGLPRGLSDGVWPRHKIRLTTQVDLPPADVARIEYLLDGNVLATATAPPWEVTPAPLVGAGSGLLGVRAVLKDGRTINHPAPLQLHWKEPNDDFADASLVEGDAVLVGVSNMHATREPGEPSHGADGLEWRWQQTLWWKYQAKTNGALLVSASTHAPTFRDNWSPYLAAYDAGRVRIAGSAPGGNNLTGVLVPIEAGQTYHIAVASFATNDVGMYFVTIPRLTNDDFNGAEPIPELPATVLARFGLATVQQGEQWPAEWEGRITQSLWWRLVSPGNGYLVVNVGYPSGPASGLYLRAPHLAGSWVAPLPSSFGLKTYPVQAGRAYWLALGRHAGGVDPEEAHVSFVSPATNDRFAQRLPESGAPIQRLLPIADCTLEAGEPTHPGVDPAQVRGSVWVSWTARTSGQVTLSARGAAQLVVYQGNSLAGLFPVAANGNADCSFIARAGSTYQIAVIAAKTDPALVELSLEQNDSPPNDDFADATSVSGIKTRLLGNTWLATREFGEPPHAGYLGGSSCWWVWRAPVSGAVQLRAVTPPNRPLAMAVYSGSQVNSLMAVPAARQDGGTTLEFAATAGHSYRIVVDDLNGWGGDVDLELAQDIAQAQFASVQPATGGFELTFAGPSGTNYALEYSTDLESWVELATGFHSDDLQSLLVAPDTNEGIAFFRLRSINVQ